MKNYVMFSVTEYIINILGCVAISMYYNFKLLTERLTETVKSTTE